VVNYTKLGPYEMFCGKECGVALAKMSFEAKHIGDLKGCSDLNFGEKTELEGWIEKFTFYRNYPIKGRLVADDYYLKGLQDQVLTTEEMTIHTGGEDKDKIPEGYATAPIYIGAGDKVYDVSFGGVEFYGERVTCLRSLIRGYLGLIVYLPYSHSFSHQFVL
jgi:hypothetical protein